MLKNSARDFIFQAKKELDHIARQVFVATDEPEILAKLNKDFPAYTWIGLVI